MSGSARHRPLVAAPAVVAAVVVVGLLAGCGDDDGHRVVSPPDGVAQRPRQRHVADPAGALRRGLRRRPADLVGRVRRRGHRLGAPRGRRPRAHRGPRRRGRRRGLRADRHRRPPRRRGRLRPPHELALLRLDDPLPGHVFTLASGSAAVGATAHVLGHPRGGPLSLTTGTVSGVDRRLPLGDRTLTGLLQVDAPISHGNSGGPVVDGDGVVLGLAEAAHEGAATPVDTSTCDDPASTWSRVAVDTDDPGAEVVAATFANYADALDLADLEYAWALLTPEVQQRSGGYDTWAAGLDTSSLHDLAVESVTPVDPTTDVARIRMVSTQAPEDGRAGQTCSVWHLDYRLVLDIGYYQIDRATPRDGSPQPCSPRQAAEVTSAP